MQITINGNKHSLNAHTSVASLIQELQIDPRKIAIEHNLYILQPQEYSATFLKNGDVLEIVEFIGGG